MNGVRRIGYSISKLGREPVEDANGDKTYPVMLWYEPYFVFYWGFLVKYIIPGVLWFILLQLLKADTETLYPAGYSVGWMIVGLFVPVIGLVTFLINLCYCVEEEKLNEREFTTEL